MSAAENIVDAALALGASARLTRIVVVDDIGQWWIKDPLDNLSSNYHHRHEKLPWWDKYLSGLECPFCVGQWIAFATLASYFTVPRAAWRFVAGGLTLNYAAAHLGARLGDTAEE